MKRLLIAAICLCLLCAVVTAQGDRADGANEILAVVNGKAITYQEIVGDTDLQLEINATRITQRVPPEVSDRELEKQLVFQMLQSYVLKKLLDDEADRIQLKISDAQMRGVITRQKKLIGIGDYDIKAWAGYLKEKYNLTPSEYLNRTRGEIRRNEILNYMAGAYGPLPAQYPLEIYFSLSVTPGEVRKDFERDADRWRIARNIDYRQLRLLYPAESSIDTKRKLVNAVVEGDTSVHARVEKKESLENASEGLIKLIQDLSLPGVKLEISERTVAKDDSELDPTAYQMVLSVSPKGGVSEVGSVRETDDEGQQYEGVMFVQLFSREDGDRRNFESPKVQQSIRTQLENQRLIQNRAKVEQALMKRAAIVPEKLFAR